MSKGLGKFFISKYTGAISSAWNEAVGLTLKGNASFTTADATRPGNRRVCFPILEGLAAVFGRQILASIVDVSGAVWVKIDAAAYESTPVVEGGARENVVGYYDRTVGLVGSSLRSSSGRGSKTEISVAACALVEACERWSRDENPEAKLLLEAHLEILSALEDAGAMPLGTRKVDAGTLPGDFERKLGDLTDRIYSWAVYSGKDRRSATETVWEYSPVVSWPVSGDEAEAIASIAAGDPHATLADRARLQGLLKLAPAAAPSAPAAPKPAPAAPAETFLQRAVRWARRVNLPILLQGPAGTGKTHALVASTDGLPVYRTSMVAEADVATAVGDLARSASGEWVPRLGRLSSVVRYAMLVSIVVALRRGRALTHPDPDVFTRAEAARDVWWALEALATDPADRTSREVLDERAWPYDPESWAPILFAYSATEAYTVGPVVSLFLDEIHDAAGANSSFQTLLKLALEGERVFLTEIAGAGWAPMYAHNVAFTAAGNPDEHGQFGRALRSRFGLAIGVGYPSRDQAQVWHESRFGLGTPPVPPVVLTSAIPLRLSDATYTPPPPKPGGGLSAKEITAAVDFGLWTREEHRAGRLAEGLETRGEAQICQVARYLRSEEGNASREAFTNAATLVVDRLCLLDDLGLPDRDQREALIQKVEAIARRL